MEETKKVKLNLGCGNDYREGYLNIDNGLMYPDAKVYMSADITKLEWDEDSVDEILLSHVLMYIRPDEMMILFKRWYGWLKKGGKLVVEQPNIRKIAQIIATETDPIHLDYFGLVNFFGKDNEPPHRWGYYPEGMAISLYKTGFSQCSYGEGIKKPNRDFKITATK